MSDADTGGRRPIARTVTREYAALFERSPDPMLAVGSDDPPRVAAANTSYRRTFDVDPVESGVRVNRLVDLSEPERAVVRTAAADAVGRATVEKRTGTGVATFALEAIPAPAADLVAFVRYRDVTNRRIRDQQLSVLRRVLRHDLRNDLTVVLGYARDIAETAEDPEVRDSAATIVECARDLRHVTESSGRLDAVTGAPEPTPVGDAIACVRRELADEFPDGITVDPTTEAATVDRRLGIAVEACCRTLRVHAGASTARIDAAVDDGRVAVRIAADAVLSDQQRSALAGRAETKLHHATGIGPWVARWAIRAAGGSLRLDAPDDGTTCVTLSVPQLAATADASACDDASTDDEASADGASADGTSTDDEPTADHWLGR